MSAPTPPPKDKQTHQKTKSVSSQRNQSLLGVASKKAYKPTSVPVQVCVRVRPPTSAELKKDGSICVEVVKPNQIRITNHGKPKEFSFDGVFGVEDGQKKLYDGIIRSLVSKCMEGYNGCIFAYGQTASGKTYTIQGPSHPSEDQYGLLQRVANQISEHVGASKDEYNIKVSYLEIYQEKLKDLIVGEDEQCELKIRQDPEGGLFVQGATERTVQNAQDIIKIHAAGAKHRTVGETNMNDMSSRSHAILTISVVELKEAQNLDKRLKKSFKIHIVDLAGSERADSTGATGQRLKEGSAINQSLSALGNVINALTNAERGHVPYRDSKLTYLLSDSLGGNSVTLMITCLSPVLANYEESVSSLRFAERVKTIKNMAKINMDPMMIRITELEQEVEQLKQRLRRCRCGVGLEDETPTCTWFPFLRQNKVKPLPQEPVDIDIKDSRVQELQ